MFVKFLPNQYVLGYRKGNLSREGAGLTFHCLRKTTSCCMIPISGMDVDFVFTEQTVDYQTVTVQGGLTYSARIRSYTALRGVSAIHSPIIV